MNKISKFDEIVNKITNIFLVKCTNILPCYMVLPNNVIIINFKLKNNAIILESDKHHSRLLEMYKNDMIVLNIIEKYIKGY